MDKFIINIFSKLIMIIIIYILFYIDIHVYILTFVNVEHGELRETYRPSPAIIRYCVHLFISIFKVNFPIVEANYE